MTVYTGIRRIVEDSVVQSSGQYRPGNVNDGIAGIGIPGNENTGINMVGIPGKLGKLGNEKLGISGIGIPGNENTGSDMVGIPGKLGKLGNVNDGIAGIGIPGNENTGKLRIGNAQFDGIVYKALKNNLGHACEAMPGNNPIGYVVAIELPTNTLPVRKI
jgi:hypothetical protein